ncbi:hypothetical protein RI054_04g21520 [Pseudoscourfieldia marina]
MASFYASELEARSTQSRRASLSSRTGVPPSRQLAVPVAQLWKDAVRSVIAAAVAETLPHSHDPLPAVLFTRKHVMRPKANPGTDGGFWRFPGRA